jgi:hypothetical protein
MDAISQHYTNSDFSALLQATQYSGDDTEVAPSLPAGVPSSGDMDQFLLSGNSTPVSSFEDGLQFFADGTYKPANSLTAFFAQVTAERSQVELNTFQFSDLETGRSFRGLDLSALYERTTVEIRLDFASALLGGGESGPVAPLPTSLVDTINNQATLIAGNDGRTLMDFLALVHQFTQEREQSRLVEFIEMVASYLDGGDFSSLGEFLLQLHTDVGAASGFDMAFAFNLEVEVTTERTTIQVRQRQLQNTEGADPLILDLDGDGIEVTSAENGARYDLTGDGVTEQTGTATGGDAFLALDRNGNGQVDGGNELFGDQHGASDGFAELAKYDMNGDGLIDKYDPIFDKLLLFQDLNLDGQSSDDELSTLQDHGIESISVRSNPIEEYINAHRLIAESSFTRSDGSTGRVADAVFSMLA